MLSSFSFAASGLAAVGLHLWDIFLTLALLLLATVCGRTLLRRLDPKGALAEDTWVFALLVGAGAVSTAMLALGLAGMLSRVAIGVTLLLVAGVSRSGWRDLAERLARDRAAFVPSRFLVVSILIGGFMVVESLAPPWDWDSLMYHLDVPRDYLQTGRVFLPQDNLHALYVNLVQFLYLPLMAFGGQAAPALLSTAFALSLAVLMGRYGERVFGANAGEAACALIWSSTIVVLVAVTPRVDVTVALFTFGAHCAFWSAWKERSATHLKLCALLAGLAIAAKANAIPYVAGLAVVGAALLLLREWRVRVRGAVPIAAASAALFVAAVLPWYLKNALLAGSWTDVLTVGGRLPPWLAELTGFEQTSSIPGLGRLAAHAQAREPFSFGAYFGAPGAITIEDEASFYFAGAVLVLAPFGPFLRANRKSAVFFLAPAAVFLALVLLRSPVLNTRYLVPMIPALTLVGAGVVAWAIGILARGQRRRVLGMAVALMLLPTGFVAGVTTLGYRTYRYAFGLENGRAAMERRRDLTVPTHVEKSLSGRALVLLLGDAKGYLYSVPTLQDNAATTWPILVASGHTTDCLGRTRVTHVLMRPGSEEFFRARGADLNAYRWNEFSTFAERCLLPLAQGKEYLFYGVRSTQQQPSDR